MARCSSILRRTAPSICSTIAPPTYLPIGYAATLASRSSSATEAAHTPRAVGGVLRSRSRWQIDFTSAQMLGRHWMKYYAADDDTSNMWSSPSCVNVRWLCLRPPDQLEQYEFAALQDVLEGDERLVLGYTLRQRFRRLIARRSVRDLDQWLEDAEASDLRPFVSLSHGIPADRAAVVNGLMLPWSTGPVDGTVTKVKLLKRRGYGRASTRLLRRRIISAA
jgi:transposase